MGSENSAQKLFEEINSRPLNSELVGHKTDVFVDAGAVQVFRDYSGAFGLLIPISNDEAAKFKPDIRSATLRLTAQYLMHQPHIKLALNNPRQERIFAVFVDEILSELKLNPLTPGAAVSGMLKRWRELFKESRSPVAWSHEQELGLLCELEVFYALYLQHGPEILNRWTGPEGLPHDFELESDSIECKATSSANGLRVTINGVPQLNPTEGKELKLIVRKYASNPDGTVSVPMLVDRIRDLDYLETEVFFAKLQKIGCPILENNAEIYFSRFDPVDSFEFLVTKEFPRIANIGPAERLQQVTYQLDLSGPTGVPGYLTRNLILQKEDRV
ncbi:PD-(D/E)XK motif protein [Corynebacterium casei]|uniref:PD-(D/E)XK motif protein n=1 Tax=Corynebacterium casei TaxID=160386 RepID=UPI0009C8538C|nr:PD-(D/E)XK motif protein [Corynebacterium casei]SLM88749.1 hypothetical protein CZ765_04340 [Corynebacterium casei]